MSPRADLLVVDDEQVVRGAVRKVCKAEGFAVDEAETVDAGVERLARKSYRVVLLDLMLPAVGGMRVLEVCRRDHPETPVVMITGYATPGRKIECFRGGAFDVLPKPFDANELVGVLQRAVSPHPEGSAAHGQFALGQHAWVRLEDEGTVRIGIGESFRQILGAMTTIETPAVDTELIQGKRMAEITTRDGFVHRVWSPLGGRVLERNQVWSEGSPDATPSAWVLRVLPTDLETELDRLTRI